MFKLTLAQRLSNLYETKEGLEKKIHNLTVELDRVNRKIELTQRKLQANQAQEDPDEEELVCDDENFSSTNLF